VPPLTPRARGVCVCAQVYVHLDSRELSLQRLAAGGVHYLYSRVFKLEVYATPPSATRPEAQLEARPLEVVHVLPRVISVDSVKGNIVDVRFCRLHHDTKLKVRSRVAQPGGEQRSVATPQATRECWLSHVSVVPGDKPQRSNLASFLGQTLDFGVALSRAWPNPRSSAARGRSGATVTVTRRLRGDHKQRRQVEEG
jgi:hypothetical protein